MQFYKCKISSVYGLWAKFFVDKFTFTDHKFTGTHSVKNRLHWTQIQFKCCGVSILPCVSLCTPSLTVSNTPVSNMLYNSSSSLKIYFLKLLGSFTNLIEDLGDSQRVTSINMQSPTVSFSLFSPGFVYLLVQHGSVLPK